MAEIRVSGQLFGLLPASTAVPRHSALALPAHRPGGAGRANLSRVATPFPEPRGDVEAEQAVALVVHVNPDATAGRAADGRHVEEAVGVATGAAGFFVAGGLGRA